MSGVEGGEHESEEGRRGGESEMYNSVSVWLVSDDLRLTCKSRHRDTGRGA